MRYFIRLSYHGSQFCGWQKQPGTPTVQQALEAAFSAILGQTIQIVGCGRTDTGVHAHEYFAHFDVSEPLDIDLLVYRANAYLEEGVAIQEIFSVSDDSHARFDATSRTYKYFIHTQKNPFLNDRSFYLRGPKPVNLDLMNQFCALLLTKKDFSAFEKKGSDNKHSLCHVTEAFWEKTPQGYIFTITANRFLRNMVRAIVGTGLMIGTEKITLKEVDTYIDQKIQVSLSITAPAHGLFLWNIKYPIRNDSKDQQ